jgi:hypothetical protein
MTLGIREVLNVDLIAPKFISHPLNDTEIVLNCDTDGNPEPKCEWFHNGIKLLRSDRFTIRHKKLHISKVSVIDNGIYTCSASNNAGKVNSTGGFQLKLKSNPSIAFCFHILIILLFIIL